MAMPNSAPPSNDVAPGKHELAEAPPIRALVEAELGGWEHGRKDDTGRWLQHPPHDLFGLALSGGGIRSATFNLGLLQALNRLGLLKHFHYLSTVSGGGYIGGWWSRWRAYQVEHGPPPQPAAPGQAEKRTAATVFPAAPEEVLGEEAPVVRHLREYSNFLMPRLGLFSWDTGRGVVSVLSAILPALVVAGAMLLLGVLLLVLLLAGIVPDDVSRLQTSWSPVLIAGGVTAGALALFEWIWLQRGEQAAHRTYLLAAAVAVALTGVLWGPIVTGSVGTPDDAAAATQSGWLPAFQEQEFAAAAASAASGVADAALTTVVRDYVGTLAYLYSPALVWLAVVLVFVLMRTLGSGLATSLSRRRARSAFDRVQSRVTFLVVAWIVAVTLWIAGAVLAHLTRLDPAAYGFGGATGVAALLFGLAHRRLARSSLQPGTGGIRDVLKPLLPQLLAYLTLTLAVVGLMAVVAAQTATHGGVAIGYLGGGALGVVLVALLCFNPNEVGLHGFYRSRLVRAFTGACDADSRGFTEECPADDLSLDDVRFPEDGPRVHLICCAANDLDSAAAMRNLNRGAVSATLSNVGFSVGDRFAPWTKYGSERKQVPTLGSAMTASGAAFNTLLGWRSVRFGPAVTFLMAALNLRLGLWLRHPHLPPEAGAERAWHRLPGFPFLKEMFSSVGSSDPLVHLSDGGHFENLAVYELIRRHCRVIVVSDCGQDGAGEFEDLGRLCRQVRTDFGVDIRIDVSPLRPGQDGRSRQHMVAGDIHYPDGDSGVLLYFKPVLVGSESADVFHYRTQNADFPHESTADQFYDEAQWEAYRRLGEHAGMTAFRALLDGDVVRNSQHAEEVFGRARREWRAVREGLDGGLARFRTGSAELDELLRRPENGELQRQVYPELRGGAVQPFRIFPTPEPAEVEETTGRPDTEVAESELYTLRRMLLLLHELYASEALEANHSHAAYLGMINYFGRWINTERTAFWWPVLKPHFPHPFVRFVETRLGSRQQFPAATDQVAVSEHPEGLDMLRHPPRAEGSDMLTLSYWVRLGGDGTGSRALRMACLAGRIESDGLLWRASDFRVAEGFWGIGTGQRFLEALGASVDGMPHVHCLAARLERPRAASSSQRQALATEMQLYRSAGFEEVTAGHKEMDLWNARLDAAMRAAGETVPDDHERILQWMCLTRVPAEQGRQAAPGARASGTVATGPQA
jgi:hypothetical protein